jgi:hypothetical protein
MLCVCVCGGGGAHLRGCFHVWMYVCMYACIDPPYTHAQNTCQFSATPASNLPVKSSKQVPVLRSVLQPLKISLEVYTRRKTSFKIFQGNGAHMQWNTAFIIFPEDNYIWQRTIPRFIYLFINLFMQMAGNLPASFSHSPLAFKVTLAFSCCR